MSPHPKLAELASRHPSAHNHRHPIAVACMPGLCSVGGSAMQVVGLRAPSLNYPEHNAAQVDQQTRKILTNGCQRPRPVSRVQSHATEKPGKHQAYQ